MKRNTRQSNRFGMKLPINIYAGDGKTLLDIATATDISDGGFRAQTTRFFKLYEPVTVRFVIHTVSTPVIKAVVVWSEDEEGDRRAGFKFLK